MSANKSMAYCNVWAQMPRISAGDSCSPGRAPASLVHKETPLGERSKRRWVWLDEQGWSTPPCTLVGEAALYPFISAVRTTAAALQCLFMPGT
jgi:hypothetical protein